MRIRFRHDSGGPQPSDKVRERGLGVRLECSDIGNLRASVLFGLPCQRQELLAPEDEHLVKLRPTRENKLCSLQCAPILQAAPSELFRDPRSVIADEP